MGLTELLNNITHKDLKVNLLYSAELGDAIASTVTFITEFAEVQKEYPILFRKEPATGEYQAVALFGIQKGENLFLCEPERNQAYRGWRAGYVPAAVARGPFSIGIQKQIENGLEKSVPMVHVDMAHPKVSFESGVNVFMDGGGNSRYLEDISNLLNIIRDGIQLNKLMFEMFIKNELLEDVCIDIDLVNQDKHRISGFQTINVERLSTLNGPALEQLNRMGFLQAAYFVIASLSNIKKLIADKNRRVIAE